MAKKTLNQNAKYVQDLIDSVEPDYIFSSKPLNRLKFLTEMIKIIKEKNFLTLKKR